MSTKTTFKRIALVAAAALGLGVLTSVAPATAVPVTAAATPCYVSVAPFATPAAAGSDTATATISATQVAGPANYVEVTCGTDLASGGTAVVTTSAGSTLAGFVDNGSNSAWTVATGAASATSASASIAGDTFRVMTPAAGTVTTTIARRVFANGGATDTTLQTLTITVTAAGVANVYSAANSTVLATSVTGSAATALTDAAVVATPPAADKDAASTVEVLRIDVDQEDANDVDLTTAVANTVTITGVGRVGIAVDAPLGQYAAETAQASDFYIFADGRSGVGTVTVAVNGVTVKTYTVTFYGAVATLTATTKITHVAVGATTAGVVEVVATDANGVVVPSVTITGTASSTTAITAVTPAADGDADGDQLVGVTAASTAAGAYTVTFKSGLIVSNAATFTVAKTTAKTVTLTTDKAEYNAGEKITVTVSANDSNGNGIADGAVVLFGTAGVTSTSSLQGALPASSVTLVSGKATYTAYAPLAAGPVTISGTEGTGTDSTTKAVVSATFTVLSDGVAQAAADAAAEATDAANAATDAANAAAEAADAATAAAQDAADAVAALATSVSEMVNALKKQITSLTNLVIKIQKKVRA
jgi:hypothetical protein